MRHGAVSVDEIKLAAFLGNDLAASVLGYVPHAHVRDHPKEWVTALQGLLWASSERLWLSLAVEGAHQVRGFLDVVLNEFESAAVSNTLSLANDALLARDVRHYWAQAHDVLLGSIAYAVVPSPGSDLPHVIRRQISYAIINGLDTSRMLDGLARVARLVLFSGHEHLREVP